MENHGKTATKGTLIITPLIDRGDAEVSYPCFGMKATLDNEQVLNKVPIASIDRDYCDTECFIELLNNLGYKVIMEDYE